jgi:hypothetical protein
MYSPDSVDVELTAVIIYAKGGLGKSKGFAIENTEAMIVLRIRYVTISETMVQVGPCETIISLGSTTDSRQETSFSL